MIIPCVFWMKMKVRVENINPVKDTKKIGKIGTPKFDLSAGKAGI